jgi:hypothetical protein
MKGFVPHNMMLSAVAPSAHHALAAPRGFTTSNRIGWVPSASSARSATCPFPTTRRVHPRASHLAAASFRTTTTTTAALSVSSSSFSSGSSLRFAGPLRRTTRLRRVAASASSNENDSDSGDNKNNDAPTFGGAPVEPGSPSGQMLAHVLSSEPHLFTAAVEATLERMSDDLDRQEGGGSVKENAGDEASSSPSASSDDGSGLVLFMRIQEMRALERRNGVQDLMYANIIQKFLNVGVDMLPPLDQEPVLLGGVDLNKLAHSVHSTEALTMVKEHLLGMLGPEVRAPPCSIN